MTINVPSNLHGMCLWLLSMCVQNSKMNSGSTSDENRINEYMLNKKGRTLRRAVLLRGQLCQHKKGSLLDDPNSP